MSHGVLPQSSTPSSLTLAPSGSELTRTLTIATGAGATSAGTADAGGAGATAAAIGAPGVEGNGAPSGRSAAYPTMPATTRAPTTAVMRIPFEPPAGGGLERAGPAASPAATAGDDMVLPELLTLAGGDMSRAGPLPGSPG